MQVTKAGDYLAKWLATVAILMNKIIPTVVVFFMPSYMVREVGGEGWARPSYLMSPID